MAGATTEKWVHSVGREPSAALQSLATDYPDRDQISKFCSNSTHDEIDLFLAICAWGGMKVNHAKFALAQEAALRDALRALRSQALDRREAYSIFKTARGNGLLPGVGPAYFTKLIFFVRPDLHGYIMDQWTARSINILTGQKIVKLGYENNVLDANADSDYEIFCKILESIALILGVCPEVAEMRLFSHGTRRSGVWRNYVKGWPSGNCTGQKTPVAQSQ